VKIEVEVDTIAQVEEAMAAGVDAVLLDNMSTEELRQAVTLVVAARLPKRQAGDGRNSALHARDVR
jgi:nicotinate-nucleotide pyrophosphorylase (carboxylating)